MPRINLRDLLFGLLSLLLYCVATLLASLPFRNPPILLFLAPLPFFAGMSLPGLVIGFLIALIFGLRSFIIPIAVTTSALFWLGTGIMVSRSIRENRLAVMVWLAIFSLFAIAAFVMWLLLWTFVSD
jgi:hypothetical protein